MRNIPCPCACLRIMALQLATSADAICCTERLREGVRSYETSSNVLNMLSVGFASTLVHGEQKLPDPGELPQASRGSVETPRFEPVTWPSPGPFPRPMETALRGKCEISFRHPLPQAHGNGLQELSGSCRGTPYI